MHRYSLKHYTRILVKFLFSRFGILLLTRSDRVEHKLTNVVVEYYLRQSKGILHIGAHIGQEARYYAELGKSVLWIEADSETYLKLVENISGFENQKAINVLVSDRKQFIDFHVTSNDGLSSSALKLSEFGKFTWEISNVKTERYLSKTLDDIEELKRGDYDFWIIDVQGFELQVLKGALHSLSQAKWLLVECSTQKFYEEMVGYDTVKEALQRKGFAPIFPERGDHFEMLFVKTTPES